MFLCNSPNIHKNPQSKIRDRCTSKYVDIFIAAEDCKVCVTMKMGN